MGLQEATAGQGRPVPGSQLVQCASTVRRTPQFWANQDSRSPCLPRAPPDRDKLCGGTSPEPGASTGAAGPLPQAGTLRGAADPAEPLCSQVLSSGSAGNGPSGTPALSKAWTEGMVHASPLGPRTLPALHLGNAVMAVGFLRKENVTRRGEVTRPSSLALEGGPRPRPWAAWNSPNEGPSGGRREASPARQRTAPVPAPTKDIPGWPGGGRVTP